MPRTLTFFLVLLLAFPQPLYAQSLKELLADQPALELIQKPVTTDCSDGQKCLDFENFKLYLQMRVQYVWLFKTHTGLMPAVLEELKRSADSYASAEKLQEQRAIRAEKVADSLLDKYTDAVTDAEIAKGHSVWGGGLPWLITAVAVGLAGGVALTLWIKD